MLVSVKLRLVAYRTLMLIVAIRIAFDGKPAPISNLSDLASRTADRPLSVPDQLPAFTAPSNQPRFTESSIYPDLHTNVDVHAMEFSQEPISTERSQHTIDVHGPNSPFRHWTLMRQYVKDLMNDELVAYNTTVEKAEKTGCAWQLTLRTPIDNHDYWWTEEFDAVVVASGHFSVPFIPQTEGLQEFEDTRPGSVLHSKHYRGRDQFRNKVRRIKNTFHSGTDRLSSVSLSSVPQSQLQTSPSISPALRNHPSTP